MGDQQPAFVTRGEPFDQTGDVIQSLRIPRECPHHRLEQREATRSQPEIIETAVGAQPVPDGRTDVLVGKQEQQIAQNVPLVAQDRRK
jgi:hypothetical protein